MTSECCVTRKFFSFWLCRPDARYPSSKPSDITETVPLAEQQDRQSSQHHLQSQQKTMNDRPPDGINRLNMQPQLVPMMPVPPLQHFDTIQYQNLERLKSLFPELIPAFLRKVLELCQGDFIRAVDNLLYIQRSQQNRIIPTPQPLPFNMLLTQVLGVSSDPSVASGYYGNTWQGPLPNTQLSTKLNPRVLLPNINILQQPQQVFRAPVPVPSFEYLNARPYHPQFLPYIPVVPQLEPQFHFVNSHQEPNHQQLLGTYQNLEVSKVLLNSPEWNRTRGNSVANLSAPPLIENRNLREDKENLPKNVINMGNDVTKNQCMENLKLVRTDEISEKQKSVHSSAPQKRPHFRIQDEDNNILTNEKKKKKKIKVSQYLPLTLSDASHRRCPQVSVGVGPTPGLLQSATTCPPDHIIPDKNTPQSCNIKAKKCH
ncbi:uncharacterized protein LOC110839995 isoform X2 [Zootermopsis nevadensis]|uniref:uncharacterized protein LOC110839995 isoform X2 n=1 Tax=Zootermopsis nevadensis TaxID=136037 RepID=UPI000B8E5AC2|nr:uncharacterized protein LOC110839995 isoform X2 [Zootermopsis nevadensis]